MNNAGKINATYLEEHFAATSEQENTRLAVLIASLACSTQAEVNTAVRDWSGAYKGQPSRATVQTRGGEIKSMKAAMDTGSFTPDASKGYHANVKDARTVLALLDLTNSGKPRVSKEQRDAKRAAVAVGIKAAELAGNDVSKLAETLPDAAVAVDRDTAEKLARVVIQRHGCDVAIYMAEALTAMVQDIQRGLKVTSDSIRQELSEDDNTTVETPEAAAA